MNFPMILRASAVVLLAAGILVYFSRGSNLEGMPFSFEAESLDGSSVSWTDPRFEDKVLVIDIWGTWCPPCRAEIPHLNSLYDRYADQGLEIVGIAFEHAPDRASAVRDLERFIREFAIEYPVLLGGTPSETDLFRVFPGLTEFRGFPTTIVLDRKGIVQEVTVGFSPALMNRLETAIQENL